MKVVVFGANGKVGRLVVARLLQGGHTVTAFVHIKSELDEHQNLKIYRGDVKDAGSVNEALKGQDAVVSCLGSWGTKTKDILSSGMANILPAMKKAGIKRIVSLTGSGIILPSDNAGFIDRINRSLLNLIAPKILSDGEKHIELLEKSGLDWTVVRSPVMRGSGGKYQLSDKAPKPWMTVPRASVVAAMTELAQSNKHSKSAPFIKHR